MMNNQSIQTIGTLTSVPTKIAIFNLEHTLVRPFGDAVYPKDVNDYEFKYRVLRGLNALYREGWTVIVFPS
jgi:histidinol phosphatase-like enzyme